jgi:hypothetical protein
MDPRIVPLYYLSSLAGLIMVAGGIWLLYKQKIYIDRESNQVTEIETPLGKFKTNIPALALFALGFFPLIYPIVKAAQFGEDVPIRGNLNADVYPVTVYAAVVSDSLFKAGDYSLRVPALGKTGKEYRILFISGNSLVDVCPADPQKTREGEIQLGVKNFSVGGTGAHAYQPNSIPPAPAEFK